MIRKTWNTDKWLLTAQPEHARISAIIAAAWEFPGPRPHDQVFQAIMHHDDGWKEADESPIVKTNGDPLSFNEIKIATATPIYERSIDLCQQTDQPYATALIAGHFLRLVETANLAVASTADAIAAGQFIARQRANINKLKIAITAMENGDSLLADYDKNLRFLQVCDYLSLLLCMDFRSEETIENVQYLKSGDKIKAKRNGNTLALVLKPLPFKKNLRDHLTSCIVPFIPYESTEELKMAMDEVKTVTNEVHLGSG